MAHKRVMRSRTFEYVAFFDEVAWVAGTTTYNSVAQGEDLQQAVERLRESLWLDAIWTQADGEEPFANRGLPTTPLDSFTDTSDCVTADFGLDKKGRRYTGSITVEWDENHPGWEKKEKEKPRGT